MIFIYSIKSFLFRYEKEKSPVNDFTLIDSPVLTVCVDQPILKHNLTNEFEVITPKSISSSSISIVNSTDDFTPLASPLYSTAIAYTPTSNDNNERNIYELI